MNSTTSTKLKEILRSSGLSQEQLAYKLGVSFSTLNSWVNARSEPRAKALDAIEKLHLDVIGSSEVDLDTLANLKKQALDNKIKVKDIIADQKLLDKITIHLTYHTNTIEGSTMTVADVKRVLEDDARVLSNKTAQEQTEARNHRAALFYLLDELNLKGESFRWNQDIILGTHLRLMNTLISSAGKYRNHGVKIAGSRVVLASHLRVSELMLDLIDDLNASGNDILTNAARQHAVFEKIHPFTDGNGRLGRLIIFIQSLKYGIVPPVIVKERKQAYYKCLEVADTKLNCQPLELLIVESAISFANILNSH
jgi:Fic family protein/DNA-binding XRE family transcriptional regulator